MKTYAPKGLRGSDLRGLLADLSATPAQVAKFLDVTERSVWRWMADESAPRAVLCALWHETPRGRHVTALDVGNELVIVRGLAKSIGAQADAVHAKLCRVLAISSTGAANDPLVSVPLKRPRRVVPLAFYPRLQGWQLTDDQGGNDGATYDNQGFAPNVCA